MMRFNIFKQKSNLTEDSVEDLIIQYKSTNNTAIIGEIYNRYAGIVFGVCAKYLKNEEECKDVTSKIFQDLILDLKKYEIKYFSGWLHKVTINECLKTLKKSARTISLIEENISDLHDDDDIEIETIDTIGEEEINLCIEKLNKEQSICIKLFYIEEKSYKEISDLTKLTLLQVKSSIQNGKRNLKIMLQKNHG
jgi:RNA polymerase sigma-70 factor (ECF subfamily)